MTKRTTQEYTKSSTAQVAVFAQNLKENAVNQSGTFDSAAANDFISTAINQKTGVSVPENLQVLLDEVGSARDVGVREKNKSIVARAILDGMGLYEEQHGCEAPADVIEQAIHSAYATTDEASRRYGLPRFQLDSADSNHHDQISLQPNRAVVAILSALGDAIPFAHYLPADIGSNEGKLAIMSHLAGSTYGGYAENGSMDGVNSGNAYIGASRIHKMNPAVSTGNVAGKLTTVQTDDETCDQGADTIKLLRGRTIVYVNGQVAAKEVNSSGSGNSTVSGSITLSETEYSIGGTINTDTGVFALTTTPAMPTNVPVAVEGFIDYERAPELTPSIISAVNTFSLFANPWRATTHQTIDSRTQMSNELGLDPYSESVIAIQTQFANERHYKVLGYARRLSVNNIASFNFDWDNRSLQMNKAQIWQDFFAILGAVSQKMAEDTMDHGITHLYVAKNVAAQLLSLPSTIFQPSGITGRPGIYRLGRLVGLYDVYYTPKGLSENSTSSQILCIGRATSVPLNPFVLGDAVPPSVIPLAVNADLKQGAGFYARNFTAVNPFQQASLGCAMINITNMQNAS